MILIFVISFIVLILLHLIHEAIEKIMGRRWWYRTIYLRTPHWRFTRQVKFFLSGKKCQRCDCRYAYMLDVHHKTYQHIWWEWLFPQDLEVLCRQHHVMEHGR